MILKVMLAATAAVGEVEGVRFITSFGNMVIPVLNLFACYTK